MHEAPPRKRLLGDLLAEANLVACAQVGGFNPVIHDICVDSRSVSPGACFVALRGTHNDGHDFVAEAIARGAVAVIVETGRAQRAGDIAVTVPDTHLAVARLASAFHGVSAAQRDGLLKLIGVTGTNGKTTVCTLIRAVLDAAGLRAASFGTITNDNGSGAKTSDMTTMAPLEMCRELAAAVRSGVTHAVLEVSSHALDQQRCAGLAFDVGVFTNLSRDHLDYHGDMEHYARAKRRLFECLTAGGAAVVCADDAYAEFMAEGCAARVLRYGLGSAARDVRAEHLAVDDDATRFTAQLEDCALPIATELIGRHNVRNIMAAVAAGHALGFRPEVIGKGIESVRGIPGRLERVDNGAPIRVLVDYAHTPDALDNVLNILRDTGARRLICVFGCGGDRDRGKRPEMARTVALAADAAVVTSDNPRSEDPAAIIAETLQGFSPGDACVHEVEPDRARAIRRAVALAQAGDVVLIAGKGHEKYQIVGTRRLPFDDVAEARAALAQRFNSDAAGRQVA